MTEHTINTQSRQRRQGAQCRLIMESCCRQYFRRSTDSPKQNQLQNRRLPNPSLQLLDLLGVVFHLAGWNRRDVQFWMIPMGNF